MRNESEPWMVQRIKTDAQGNGGTVFVLNSLCLGGSEKKMVAISNALFAAGYRIHIAYLCLPDTLAASIAPGITVVPLGRRGKFSFSALRRLCKYIRTEQIEHVVAVNLYPLLYACLASRISRPRRTCVALINSFDQRSRREEWFMKIYAPLLRRCDLLVFGSELQKTKWLKAYGLDSKRCRTVYNGVDTTYYRPAPASRQTERKLGFGASDFVIGTVGVLRPEKRQVDLLHAAGVLKRRGIPVRVLLVGDGPCAAHLRKVAQELDLTESVVFYGLADDVRPLLAVMDVFVLSSVTETFSNAALEAMASGCCVVLSDVGGAREMVVDGESGYVYAPGDVPELARLLGVLYGDQTTKRRLSAAARARVVEHFSYNQMLGGYQKYVISAAPNVSC